MESNKLKNRISYSDLVWDRFSHIWYEGGFIGNGIFGALVHHNEKDELMFKLGHTQIFDNRQPTETEKDSLYLYARLPIGYFTLKTESKALNCNERLDIFKAEMKGTVDTEKGCYNFKILSLRNRNVIVFDYKALNENILLQFVPFPAYSPRYVHMKQINDNDRMSDDYPAPKESKDFEKDGIFYHIQPFFNGGYFTTAYKIIQTDDNANRLFVTTQSGDSEDETVNKCGIKLNTVENDYYNELKLHYKWWENFYNKSSVKISKIEYEEFYNIQLYKAASSASPSGRVFDTCGVWLTENSCWPNAFWNLNVQLSYSPLYASDHLDLAHSLTNEIHNNMDDLKRNVPVKYRDDSYAVGRCTGRGLYAPVLNPGEEGHHKFHEAGNLTWALFYCMREYRMSMDKTVLSDTVYPVLKGAVNYYLHFLYKGKDGFLHLPATTSPEYCFCKGDDCNYDLSLLRWGLKTLAEICEILGINDEMLSVWNETLKKLCDYPHNDEEGFYITSETKYEKSHRHYSHLLMFYPLHLLDLDNPEERKLALTSLVYWHSKPQELQGYSQTGGGAMRAMLGDGNGALNHLKNLWKGFILPNTMYKENISPVLETPLAAATTIQEMMLQSDNGVIGVFPAIPDEWESVSFDGFLCEGGFKVSASINKCIITELKVKSLFGNRCIIKGDIEHLVKGNSKITQIENNKYEFLLDADEEIKFNCDCFNSISFDEKLLNCYGLNIAHDYLTESL